MKLIKAVSRDFVKYDCEQRHVHILTAMSDDVRFMQKICMVSMPKTNHIDMHRINIISQ